MRVLQRPLPPLPAVANRAPAGVGSAVPTAHVNFDDLPDPVTRVIDFSDIDGLFADDEELAPAARRSFAYPGVSAAAIVEMRAADGPDYHHRYDPDRLLPRTAMVRRVRVDRVRCEQPSVPELCAAAGLVYAKRGTAVAA